MPRSVLWFRVKRLLVFKHCVFRRHACRIFNRRILNPFTITVADNLLDCRLFSVSKTENLPQLVWSFYHSQKNSKLDWSRWFVVSKECRLRYSYLCATEAKNSSHRTLRIKEDRCSLLTRLDINGQMYQSAVFIVNIRGFFFAGTELSGWNLHNFITIGMLITSLFTQILKIISSPWLVPLVQPSY